MSDQSEKAYLQRQIMERMREKETEELISIWREDNRDEWRPEAFEAVETILIERLGKLPEREEPAQEDESDKETVITFPADRKLFWIADLSNSISWVILAVAIIYAIARLVNYFSPDSAFPQDLLEYPVLINATMVVLAQLDALLYAGFTFLVLQAITEIIYLLMDMRELIQANGSEDAEVDEQGNSMPEG